MDSSSHTGHPFSCPPTRPWSYLGHQRHVSTHGPPPHQSHQNSGTCRRVMQKLRKQPLLSTAMKLSLRFGYRKEAGNPALSVFPWLLLGGCMGVKGGLEDASREDNLILGGRVIRIDSWRCHAPPAGAQTQSTWQHKPSTQTNIHFCCKAVVLNLSPPNQHRLVDTKSQCSRYADIPH